jgi:hypothetical protein
VKRPLRVIHFVTGGFSGGATQVAIALVNAQRAGDAIEPLLVLRRKRRTDPARIDELRAAGVQRAVLGLPVAGPDKLLATMDRYTAALA